MDCRITDCVEVVKMTVYHRKLTGEKSHLYLLSVMLQHQCQFCQHHTAVSACLHSACSVDMLLLLCRDAVCLASSGRCSASL